MSIYVYDQGREDGRNEERADILKLIEGMKTSDEAADAAWQGRDWDQVSEQQDNDFLIDEILDAIKKRDK